MNNNNISQSSTATVKDKKKKRKFNIVDFFVLLIIILVIAVAAYAISPWSQIKKFWSTDEISFSYAVEIRGVEARYISNIKDGDMVLDSVTKKSLGIVSSIENIEKSAELNYIFDENGVAQGTMVEYSDRYDITVHITATAEYEDDIGYTVNGCRVAVGEELFFRFPNYEHSAFCVAIAPNS